MTISNHDKTRSELRTRRLLHHLTLRGAAETIGCTTVAVFLAESGMRPGGRVVRDLTRYLMSLDRNK